MSTIFSLSRYVGQRLKQQHQYLLVISTISFLNTNHWYFLYLACFEFLTSAEIQRKQGALIQRDE